MYPTAMNRCNLPPWAIASRHYNRHPKRLEIQGVQHNGRPLFEKLDGIDDPELRGALFHDFMDVRFQLHQWQREETVSSRKSLKNSYLRFLRGWLFDSNSIEGAVLKGWVESRLGLAPTFHRTPIEDIHSEAYFLYTVDRMKGSARTSAILPQIDLLYEFVQYELRRRYPDQTHVTLYRGVYDLNEHIVLESVTKHHHLLRLNNLNSFTDDFERAWEFGNRVLEAEVPLTKVFFMSGLLPRSLLKGEREVLVIGGEFDVKVLIGG
ncbi:MAG: NAD(+)--dinitrogen-reductase ADP-D-ribosyltransferase [Deltaproteobacteria bacterium]|jgi:NAD+--dinitrogen-reductase ADP-D-ribosyltransferase|nr:NAD(+)--dinitrogen-reductase ADP-D-ribosyltransferase [Deltaproteobacteria bacterium]